MNRKSLTAGETLAMGKTAQLLFLAFAMTLPTLMAWLYFKQLGGQGAAANPLQQAAYSGSKAVQFALPVLFLWLTERRIWAVGRPRLNGWPVGVGFGLAVGAAMLVLYHGYLRDSPALADTPAKLRAKLHEFAVDSAGSYWMLAIFIVLIHSLLEEYYWRWFVFGQLRRFVPVALAIALSSLAFMAHHVIILDAYLPGRFWSAAFPFALGIAVGGAVWAWLYDRADSIYSPWISHALVDAAIFVIGWDLLNRTST